MKKVSALIVVLAVLSLSGNAMAGKWVSSFHGITNCFGTGDFYYPGDDVSEVCNALPWYLGGDDFMDNMTCLNNAGSGYRWQEWKQPGSSGRRILAANLKIAHAAFSGGRIYIVASGRKLLVGNLTPSDIGGRAIFTYDVFDLTPLAQYLTASAVTLRLEIPSLAGGFSIDRGAIDSIEIEGYLN